MKRGKLRDFLVHCQGKRRFRTQATAAAVGTPYPCNACGDWHVQGTPGLSQDSQAMLKRERKRTPRSKHR